MRALRRAMSGLITLLLATTAFLIPTPASAASLVQVTDFGYNPTNLAMHLYVPDTVARHPAVVVALHYCTGSGPVFHAGTPFAALADQFGFIVIYPSATRDSHCFDVSSPEALKHNGHSDPAAIVSMVRYVERRYHADASRVFATGLSSGAMMTNVLLGDYPEIFRAGAAFAGVPFGCFATTNGSEWNSECANGQVVKTPGEWGDLVRAADPGYRGPRPRMQLWHGTEDTILHYPNFGEEIKQWTNVAGLSQTPTSTDSPQASWTRTRYADRFGRVAVEAISIAGGSHNLPVFSPNNLAAYAIQFFGLSDGVPLSLLAERTGRFYGTAIVLEELGSNAPYTQVARTQFDMVTPGNAMKWETTEPSPGVFNFGPGDQVQGVFPTRYRRPAPYLWSLADIRRLLEAAGVLEPPLKAATMQTLFGLLAVTGMRVGEVVAVGRDDVDLAAGVIRVGEQITKHERARLLPLHPTSVDALRDYTRIRDRLCPRPSAQTFFVTADGGALDRHAVHRVMKKLTIQLGLRSDTIRPRSHDLRHSFAVRTLIDCQQAGEHVDERIAALSTYLGHVAPSDTYWYLTAKIAAGTALCSTKGHLLSVG